MHFTAAPSHIRFAVSGTTVIPTYHNRIRPQPREREELANTDKHPQLATDAAVFGPLWPSALWFCSAWRLGRRCNLIDDAPAENHLALRRLHLALVNLLAHDLWCFGLRGGSGIDGSRHAPRDMPAELAQIPEERLRGRRRLG
jgi:hypothetical protein